jgi:hypothetical protein
MGLKLAVGQRVSVFRNRDDRQQAYRFADNLPASATTPGKAGEQIGSGEIVDGKSQQVVRLIAPAQGRSRLTAVEVGMI